MNKKGIALFKVLRLKSTTKILKSLLEGEKQYTDFLEFTNERTATRRVHELTSLGIIKHHIRKQQTRKEWYTLTDKGRMITQAVIELEELLTC
jgi:DNA-binding HxlR family transcriptional regulator